MQQRKKVKTESYKKPESEVYLSRKAEDRRRNQYLQDIFRIPVLSVDEERALARLYQQENDVAAGNRLVEAHLRLVPSIARRVADEFGHRPSEEDTKEAGDGYWNLCRELELAGNEGLLKARDRFDLDRRTRFSTCARYSIFKACREEARLLRSPVRYPQRQAALPSISLNQSAFEDGEETLQDQLSAEPTPSLGGLCDLRVILERKVQSLLNPRERHIIRARYLTDEPQKLRKLSAELDISACRAHQLEQRAINKLQEPVSLWPASPADELAQLYAASSTSDLDEWIDIIKQAPPSATAADRREAHRQADVILAGASDYNLNRVRGALDAGLTVREVATKLGLPLERVEHIRQLIDWRHGQEVRYTLTDKALAMFAYRGKDKAV